MSANVDEPHPSGCDRLRVYVLYGDRQERLAETSIEGLGLCLLTLFEEGQITDRMRVGVRDRLEHRWIVNPYTRGIEEVWQ